MITSLVDGLVEAFLYSVLAVLTFLSSLGYLIAIISGSIAVLLLTIGAIDIYEKDFQQAVRAVKKLLTGFFRSSR